MPCDFRPPRVGRRRRRRGGRKSPLCACDLRRRQLRPSPLLPNVYNFNSSWRSSPTTAVMSGGWAASHSFPSWRVPPPYISIPQSVVLGFSSSCFSGLQNPPPAVEHKFLLGLVCLPCRRPVVYRTNSVTIISASALLSQGLHLISSDRRARTGSPTLWVEVGEPCPRVLCVCMWVCMCVCFLYKKMCIVFLPFDL